MSDLPVAPLNPFRALLTLAHDVHARELSRLSSLVGGRRQDPHEWGPAVSELEVELRRLKSGALLAAERTPFPVEEVERRVDALADAILSTALWQRDAPTLSQEERERARRLDEWRDPAGDYLLACYNRMTKTMRGVEAIADALETRRHREECSLVDFWRALLRTQHSWQLLAAHVWLQISARIRKAHGVRLTERFTNDPDVPRTITVACGSFFDNLRELSKHVDVPGEFAWLWCGQKLTANGDVPDFGKRLGELETGRFDDWSTRFEMPFLTSARKVSDQFRAFKEQFKDAREKQISGSGNPAETRLRITGALNGVSDELGQRVEVQAQKRKRLHDLLKRAIRAAVPTEPTDKWGERLATRLLDLAHEAQSQGWNDWLLVTSEGASFTNDLIEMMLPGDRSRLVNALTLLGTSPSDLQQVQEWLKRLAREWPVVAEKGWLRWTLERDFPAPTASEAHAVSNGEIDDCSLDHADFVKLKEDAEARARQTWDDDPIQAFELLRDRAIKAIELVNEIHRQAVLGPSGEDLSTVAGDLLVELLDVVVVAQAVWSQTPISRFLDRAGGPVFLDRSDGASLPRVAGSCYHDLGLGVAVGLLNSVEASFTAGDYVADMRLRTAAGDDVAQRLGESMAQIRCECQRGIERWRDDRIYHVEEPNEIPQSSRGVDVSELASEPRANESYDDDESEKKAHTPTEAGDPSPVSVNQPDVNDASWTVVKVAARLEQLRAGGELWTSYRVVTARLGVAAGRKAPSPRTVWKAVQSAADLRKWAKKNAAPRAIGQPRDEQAQANHHELITNTKSNELSAEDQTAIHEYLERDDHPQGWVQFFEGLLPHMQLSFLGDARRLKTLSTSYREKVTDATVQAWFLNLSPEEQLEFLLDANENRKSIPGRRRESAVYGNVYATFTPSFAPFPTHLVNNRVPS